jgi:hypothetical protein
MSDISEVLKTLLEHTESLDIKENVYLETVNLLKKCFEENESIQNTKPPVIKECNVKINLQNCMCNKECIIKISKIEKIYVNEYDCHYYNIHYNINNGIQRIHKSTYLDNFGFFANTFCKLYRPKVVRFEYNDDIKITYKVEDVLKHMVDLHTYNDRFKTFHFEDEDEDISRLSFNHYDFYKEVFMYIFDFMCIHGLEI